MIFIACIVPIIVFGHPDIAALSGDLIKKTETEFIANFSYATSAIDGIEGDYSKVHIKKIDCSNIQDTK